MGVGGREAARSSTRWLTRGRVLLVLVLALSGAAHNVAHAVQLSGESCAICSTMSGATPSQGPAPIAPRVAPPPPPGDTVPLRVTRIASGPCAPRGPPVL